VGDPTLVHFRQVRAYLEGSNFFPFLNIVAAVSSSVKYRIFQTVFPVGLDELVAVFCWLVLDDSSESGASETICSYK